MRYKDNLLAQKYDVLYEKHMNCKKNEKYMDPFSLADIDYIKNAETELAFFEELHFHETMVFDNENDELSVLKIIKDNFKKLSKPANFYFDNGKIRRPVLKDKERNFVAHLLTPRTDGFTGCVRVNNWSSDDPDNKVTVSFEKKVKEG